jgi:hypothetical protein
MTSQWEETMTEFLARYLQAQWIVAPALFALAIVLGLMDGEYKSVLIANALANGVLAAILAV